MYSWHIIMSANDGALNGEFWAQLWNRFVNPVFHCCFSFLFPNWAKRFFQKSGRAINISHYILSYSFIRLRFSSSTGAGLEPIIGAFAAGLALNRLIPQSSALMKPYRFFWECLIYSHFPLSRRMIVNIKVVLNGWENP